MAERGQAFTLEGFVAGVVLLTAVLLALQTVVAPPSGGSVDRSAALGQQAEDVLRTKASAERDLTHAVRYWDSLRREFVGARSEAVGYGSDPMPPALFGGAFEEAFTAKGVSFNVVVRYHRPGTTAMGRLPLVYQEAPGSDAVTVQHVATLYDDMRLTAPDAGDRELHEYDTNASDDDEGYYPIPDAGDGAIYNVLEVRVTVW